MAVRIEFFTIDGTDDFERVPASTLDEAVAAFDGALPPPAGAAVRCVGWLSASDQDEERFTDWCDEVDDDLGIGLGDQGVDEAVGVTPPPVAIAALGSDGDWASLWSSVLRGALEAAAGGRLGWRTNYDVPGVAQPHDDYPTAGRPVGEPA